MRPLYHAVLYTALALGANAAAAEEQPAVAKSGPETAAQSSAQTSAGADAAWKERRARIEGLMSGDMRKLVLPETLGPPVDAQMVDDKGTSYNLSDWRGKTVLVNFWATWCAPCRKEMPELDDLQAEMGGAEFDVLTVATGRNPVPAIDKFFTDESIMELPKLRDPDQAFARKMSVLGLPVSVIFDPEGREVARLTGDAAWNAPEARAIIAAIVAADG